MSRQMSHLATTVRLPNKSISRLKLGKGLIRCNVMLARLPGVLGYKGLHESRLAAAAERSVITTKLPLGKYADCILISMVLAKLIYCRLSATCPHLALPVCLIHQVTHREMSSAVLLDGSMKGWVRPPCILVSDIYLHLFAELC